MKKIKVIISYVKLNIDALLTKCKRIQQDMTGNANFPTPEPTIPAYALLVTAYENSIIDAKGGSKLAIAQRNTLRLQLLEKTKALGQYVNFVADGNLDMGTSSGFDMAKLPTPTIMGNPVNLRIMQGLQPGSLISKVKKPKGCVSLNHQITKHPLTDKSVWTDGITSLSSYQFDELEQGEMYWVRVIAIGGNNQKTYSEEVPQFVTQRNIKSVA